MSSGKQNPTRRQHDRVTASDVARLAGVSPMTVSRVVNGEARVRQSTRTAVLRAIEELGYSPNKAARSLASANPIRIALLYANPSSTYLSAMLMGVLEQARQSDTQVFVVECSVGSDAAGIIDYMIGRGVEGILLAPPLSDALDILKKLRKEDIPAVTIGAEHGQDGVSSVNIDDYRAAHAITRHVISLGHRRIGFIIGNSEQSASRLRLRGFRDAAMEAGLEIAPELVVQGEFSYRSGFESGDRLLNLERPPTAIVACNDDMAAGVIATAYRHHLDVPGDLTVCGFDDTMLATTVWPEITTIRQPIAEMANAAIEMLEKCIRRQRSGLEVESRRRTFGFRLVERQSDGVPRVSGTTAGRPRPEQVRNDYSVAARDR